MKRALIFGIVCLGLWGCGAFQYNPSMPVATGSATPGEGNSVTFKGDPLPLAGQGVRVGEALPSAVVTANDLSEKDMAETRGKVRIISVVPSLDTPVCEQQTHAISEKNGGLDRDVQLITVSMDLPFAQKRFSEKAKITNVLFLSDYRTADFGQNYGLLIKPLHLLSRAVIVVDRENVVRYVQVVPEITSLPDLEEAMRVARELL
jgi:thioredoxin-dependent peroxiredoxin